MTTHRLDHRGFITEGPVDGTSTAVLDGHVTFSNAPTIPSKYQVLRDAGRKSYAGQNVHFAFTITGSNTNLHSGTAWCNTSSCTFYPSAVGKTYHMRIDGIVSSSSGNPIFHLDFEQSGLVATGSNQEFHNNYSINKQSHDFDVVRGTLGHSHIHMDFLVLATQDLFVSGGQFFCSTDGNQIVTVASATLMIVEN